MKIFIGILLILVISFSCKNGLHNKEQNINKTEYKKIIKDKYELNKSISKTNAVLILLGNYSENAETIEREFKILKDAKENNIAILYLNFNQKLWLTEDDKIELSDLLKKIFKDNKLPKNNIYIGGFSIGGNIGLLLSNYLIKNNKQIQPKGVFVVDSPVDLLALYKKCEKNVNRNFSEISVKEGNWLIRVFNENFGNPKDGIKNFEQNSPFISESNYMENVANLNKIKIRFYTEPDANWWKIKRQYQPEDLNAFSIEKLTKNLQNKFNSNRIELIKTENKGYRSNGEKNPHSWSIVNKEKLIEWMLRD